MCNTKSFLKSTFKVCWDSYCVFVCRSPTFLRDPHYSPSSTLSTYPQRLYVVYCVLIAIGVERRTLECLESSVSTCYSLTSFCIKTKTIVLTHDRRIRTPRGDIRSLIECGCNRELLETPRSLKWFASVPYGWWFMWKMKPHSWLLSDNTIKTSATFANSNERRVKRRPLALYYRWAAPSIDQRLLHLPSIRYRIFTSSEIVVYEKL